MGARCAERLSHGTGSLQSYELLLNNSTTLPDPSFRALLSASDVWQDCRGLVVNTGLYSPRGFSGQGQDYGKTRSLVIIPPRLV